MTAPIRLTPALPVDSQANGLLGNIARFIKHPDDSVLAVVRLGTVRLITDIATGAQLPVIGIEAIELSCPAVSEATLAELLDVARQARVGFKLLPFESDDQDLVRGDDR